MSRTKQKVFILFLVAAGVITTAAIVGKRTRSNPDGPTSASGPASPKKPRPVPTPKGLCVIVEKSAQRLTVYNDGEVVNTYRSASGTNKGDKIREGDRRTPEGEFYVCYKNKYSRFTLSLGLSYPNIEDAERGLRDGLITQAQHDAIVKANRQRKKPPWYTPLGGEIMIHGKGSKSDWTAGCVALDDEDIKELFYALPTGTPVQIHP